MSSIPFLKMHGAGNDFAIIDNRDQAHAITPAIAARMANRRFGIGCDQLIVLEQSEKADLFMRIYNPDGSESGACGNATRCVGWLLIRETGKEVAVIETRAGRLTAEKMDDFSMRVDMGEPKLAWNEIPLAERRNIEHLGIAEGSLMDPVAVNMGNPHMVFFVKDLNFVDLARDGRKLETHALFPQGANISAVELVERDYLRAQVWERGAGLTLACGTAACAMVVAGVQRGICHREAQVELPGGILQIHWHSNDNRVRMTGPVALVFEGEMDRGALL